MGIAQTPRKILHLDLDAFFCAVEELRDPTLQGKPFAVGGLPEQRGVVASCSYAARRFGIHSAMPMGQALRRYPDLIVIHGRHSEYAAYSCKVMAQCANLSHLVEQISIDEAFLDVSDLRAAAETLAYELQATIWDDLHLPCSIGVATNKLVAKIANNVGKSRATGTGAPMAITVVPPGEEAAFLAPLPITELWGVGPKTAVQLTALGILTIGDLARLPAADLLQHFGEHGRDLAQRACGEDDRPVMIEHEVKSVSHETTFEVDVTDGELLRRTLRHLAEGVGRRMRQTGIQGNTVRLKLRWADYTTITRQVALEEPTDLDAEISAAVVMLFDKAWSGERPVRLIGVGVSGLREPVQQLGLWETSSDKGRKLQETLDAVRERFGSDAVKRASDLNQGS
ncbi:MAG: DNA polymerase IV [Chloroflexi bacterium ADurb.Bin360]|nr:MAG: DNA polymerase IV [Chloroflexi bacterium ADurb.Bin360]